MSVQFTVSYKGKKFKAEITRDGDLIFLDYDLNYDLSMVEFGETATNAVLLAMYWKEAPVEVICNNLRLKKGVLLNLAADWAEHVLHFFEDQYGVASGAAWLDKTDKRPRICIEAVRYVSKTIGTPLEGHAVSAVGYAWRAAWEAAWMAEFDARKRVLGSRHITREICDSARTAALAAEHMGRAAHERGEEDIISGATWARSAVGYDAARKTYGEIVRYGSEWNKVYSRASNLELAWQVRHFVHAIECAQSGKPWPSIKGTP